MIYFSLLLTTVLTVYVLISSINNERTEIELSECRQRLKEAREREALTKKAAVEGLKRGGALMRRVIDARKAGDL